MSVMSDNHEKHFQDAHDRVSAERSPLSEFRGIGTAGTIRPRQ